MFSTETATPSHGHSLRPKRSRRAASDDSIKLPRAKRRRSALRVDTFEPLTDLSPNEVAAGANGNITSYARVPVDKAEHDGGPPTSKGLTLRTIKKVEKRVERGSGTMTLTSNDFYDVEQLPALPEQIRSKPTVPYHSTISPEHGYALALTHSEALIWSYNSSSTTPSTKDLFSFKLPFPPATMTEPLPLGVFAAKAVGNEPGLVVVTPNKGRVVYWETIANASSFLPGQTSSGVEGSVPGMFSGETIKDVINTEPAGFILTFSHGRVAHLTVKDQLGRPSIGIQFLRKGGGANSGGLFGTIRNIVGGERRQSVAAVRPGKATKGQRDVIIVTAEGDLEHWSTHLNVADTLCFQVGLKEELLEALKHNLPDNVTNSFRLRVVDFLVVERSTKGNELMQLDSQPSSSILLLASLSQQAKSTFYIVEALVSAESSTITVVHPISCYKPLIEELNGWTPRLCVPNPGRNAFVVFGSAVVVYSLAKIEESPSSQLLMDGQRLPDPLQDCIKFQNDTIYHVLGFAAEDKDAQEKGPSCVLAVQGFGNIRIVSTASSPASDEGEEFRISLKSRIEQAIFFGTLRQNPLDLTSTDVKGYSSDEIEEAALSISHEILSSTSKYMPKTSPSIDQYLKLRAKALEDLVVHVQKYYGPLSRVFKWKLLWNAEKLAAAQAMWKVQEDVIKRKPKERKETYWEQVIFFMGDKYLTRGDESKGETDAVRLWLSKDVYRIEYLLAWLQPGHKEVTDDDFLNQSERVENIRESSDLWSAGLGAAYKFREDNAPLYGLGDEIFDTHVGVLKSGYQGLPQAWTVEEKLVRMGELLLQLVFDTTHQWWRPNVTNDAGAPSRKTVIHMGHALPNQVDFCQRMFAERYRWQTEQDREEHPEYHEQAQKMMIRADGKRREYLHRLAGFGFVQDALDLAEKWKDMKSLVELHIKVKNHPLQAVKDGREPSSAEIQRKSHEMEKMQARTDSYFDKYGSMWAKAHFDKMVEEGELGSLLGEGQTDGKKQAYLTQFLRRNAGYQKISWINDVVGETNYGHAARTLEALATKKNEDLWTTKTELCLAKLTKMAATETDPKAESNGKKISTTKLDDRLALLDVQSQVYAHISASIGPVIDATGAQEVALETFAKRIVGGKKLPALKALLNDGLGLLLCRRAISSERLVDILTLMDPVVFSGPDDDDPQVLGHEFWLAFRVLQLAEFDAASTLDGLTNIIWRRAMIRDDWIVLNDTTDKNDAEVTEAMTQTSLFRTLVAYYEHLQHHPGQSTAIKLLSPCQVLNTELFPKSMQKRFREHEVDLVLHDLEAENKVLTNYVEKGRLELHYGGLVKMAQVKVRAEADQAGDEVAANVGKV